MGRKLFLEKMSDDKLLELLSLIDDYEIKGYCDNEEVCNYLYTWYDNKVGLERLLCLQFDAFREASLRWRKIKIS